MSHTHTLSDIHTLRNINTQTLTHLTQTPTHLATNTDTQTCATDTNTYSVCDTTNTDTQKPVFNRILLPLSLTPSNVLFLSETQTETN